MTLERVEVAKMKPLKWPKKRPHKMLAKKGLQRNQSHSRVSLLEMTLPTTTSPTFLTGRGVSAVSKAEPWMALIAVLAMDTRMLK